MKKITINVNKVDNDLLTMVNDLLDENLQIEINEMDTNMNIKEINRKRLNENINNIIKKIDGIIEELSPSIDIHLKEKLKREKIICIKYIDTLIDMFESNTPVDILIKDINILGDETIDKIINIFIYHIYQMKK